MFAKRFVTRFPIFKPAHNVRKMCSTNGGFVPPTNSFQKIKQNVTNGYVWMCENTKTTGTYGVVFGGCVGTGFGIYAIKDEHSKIIPHIFDSVFVGLLCGGVGALVGSVVGQIAFIVVPIVFPCVMLSLVTYGFKKKEKAISSNNNKKDIALESSLN